MPNSESQCCSIFDSSAGHLGARKTSIRQPHLTRRLQGFRESRTICPMHYLLFYEVGDDYVARRAEFRNQHLAKGWAASERGELVLGGALANPVDGAVLLFKGDS